MVSFFRRPPTCLDMVIAIPFYLLIWLVMNLLVRPIVGTQRMAKHFAGEDDALFGAHGPRRVLSGAMTFAAIIFLVIVALWYLGRVLP